MILRSCDAGNGGGSTVTTVTTERNALWLWLTTALSVRAPRDCRLKERKCKVNKCVMFSFVYCMFYVLIMERLKGVWKIIHSKYRFVWVDTVEGATITQLCHRSIDDDNFSSIHP